MAHHTTIEILVAEHQHDLQAEAARQRQQRLARRLRREAAGVGGSWFARAVRFARRSGPDDQAARTQPVTIAIARSTGPGAPTTATVARQEAGQPCSPKAA